MNTAVSNKDVVALLEEIALLLDLSGESSFKSRAYTNVARQIEQLDEDIGTLVAESRLREIKGVGDALQKKIEEFVGTGQLAYHEKLREKFPDTLFELFGIPGLGPKRIKQVYEDLKIASLADLEAACTSGGLSGLKGFGPKMQEKLLKGIAFRKRHSGLHHFDIAFYEAGRLLETLSDTPGLHEIEVAGSLRRRKEVVKDVDLIASSAKPDVLMKRFVEDPEVADVTGHGDTKSSVVLKSGLAADLRVVTDEQFPFALAHFTGSKEHNVVMRQRAKDRGWKLNEYGLFDGDELIPCKSEADLYAKLDLPSIPPELREDLGEFDVDQIPPLIELDDVRGMVHCHSTYSDGTASIREMAAGARDRGYAYITMTDHSQSAAYAGGLKPDRVAAQQREIDELNEELRGTRIVKGIESDIRPDGRLDYEPDVLESFEVVIGSVHSNLNMTEDEATRRVVAAIEDPHLNILGHPTGRLLLSREGFPLKWDTVFDACVANHVAIEINANCRRLDLDWRLVRPARDKGVLFSIGPDAHSVDAMDYMQFGVGIARKGWLAPEHVINCLDTKEFLSWCRK